VSQIDPVIVAASAPQAHAQRPLAPAATPTIGITFDSTPTPSTGTPPVVGAARPSGRTARAANVPSKASSRAAVPDAHSISAR
jgi:hypothetical protein